MKLIVCVDDKNGMMFNKRRQSKDKVLIHKIIQITKSHTVYVDNYSKQLFEENLNYSSITNADFCFIENPDLIPNVQFDEIFVFKWNRLYPFDKKFNLDLSQYSVAHEEDFIGNSHDKITLIIYKRR